MPFAVSRSVSKPRKSQTTVGGTFDGRTLAQLLKTNQVNRLPKNYDVEDQGRIKKRQGEQNLVDNGSAEIVFDEEFTSTLRIIAYGTTLAFWNLNDNVVSVVKSDFTNSITGGQRYGNTFYTCNDVDGEKIFATTLPTMAYTGQSTNFTVGQVVTDSVTGATAVIIADSDSGATGTLTLDSINGSFGANAISDPLGGDGTGSALTYTNTAAISAASGTVPKCKRLFIFDSSLVALNTDTSKFEAHLSDQNSFTNWDTSSANDGQSYKIVWERYGEVTTAGSLDNQGIENLGNQILVGYENGYIIGHNSISETSGTFSQKFVFDATRPTGVISLESTAQGIYYSNPNGVFLRRVTQDRNTDDINLTRNFGTELNDFDFTNSKMLFVPEKNRLVITLRRASDTNNAILVHNTETTFTKSPSWWRYEGWTLNTLSISGNTVYGGSSVSTKMFKLFTGSTDADSPISYDYEQILNINELQNVGDLKEVFMAATLSFGAPVTVGFDILTETGGRATPPNNSVKFSASGSSGSLSGQGTAAQGQSAMGGADPTDGTAFTRKWNPLRIYGYSALILRITGSDKLAHEINWISVNTEEQRPQRQGVTS